MIGYLQWLIPRLWAVFLLLAIAAIGNATMDTLQHHFGSSIFADLNPLFWDPEISWMNKYAGGDPDNGPAFLFSTSLLVAFTDGWHLAKLVFLSSFFLALMICPPFYAIMAFKETPRFSRKWFTLVGYFILDFLLLRLWFGLIFELFYQFIFT